MVALGIVPAGRGADFARMFRWPTEPEAALARACQVVPRAIDVGIATFDDGSSRYFLNIAGVGFDAMVAEQATASRLPGAFAPYLSGIVSALVSNLHQEMTVETNGTRFAGPMMSVVAANGQYFGGGFNIVPAARVDDGLLNLAIIGALSPFALLRELPRVYRGAHTDHPGFTHLTASTIRVETAGAARVELDGEVIGSAPVTFSLKPGALCLAD
jgi:diacylglycerol kinase (ATP)